MTFPGSLSFFGITRAGAAYITLMMLVSLAAVRAGSNALYALLAAMMAALVVSGLVSRHALKQLSLTLRTPDRIFAGTRVSTRVSLTNLKRVFPSFALSVEEDSPSRRAAHFPILRAGETRSEQLAQTFPRRGRWRQTLQVSTRFPFGFFSRCEPLPAQELLVYPALGEVPESLRRQDVFSGQMESRERGDGDSFYAIREYRDGESVRVIDWKATAKTRRLMAREYAREQEIRCLLVLDTFAPSLESDEESNEDGEADAPFEKAVSLAAGLAAHFLREGALVELLTPEKRITASGAGGSASGSYSKDSHLYRILETLAMTRRQREKPLPDMRGIASARSFKIILTPRPPESFPAETRRTAHIIVFDGVR